MQLDLSKQISVIQDENQTNIKVLSDQIGVITEDQKNMFVLLEKIKENQEKPAEDVQEIE